MSEVKEKLEDNKELEKETVNEEKKLENRELADTKLELEETTDRLKRIMAEFENYKKRSNKEREMLYNSILADIIASFLPVIDNLEKAVEAKTEDEGYKQGIELVLKQFTDVLTKLGVEEIATVGETFDPEIHDAVSSVQDDEKGEKEIVEVYRKGYKIGTKVIRHAMVVVAN
ncbi:MAG: nucleotide exchange factor GrpE [Clostridia bacterium]|nr:nucleotide exchange factor GrpE [Clostridia bacterium]